MKIIKIVEKFRIWFGLSILIICIGVAFAAAKGLNYGIDFTGGTMLQINIGKTVSIDDSKNMISKYNLSPEIQHAGEGKTQIIIKTKKALGVDERTEIFKIFKDKYALKDSALMSTEQFGPSIGFEMEQKALIAVLIASAAMLIFIAIRFEFKFAVAAIVALFHDIVILFAIYAVFGVPINMSFIAAILTIVGYSMNDTIVVFDRIRENLSIMKKVDPIEVANMSLIQVLPRSINTTLATILVIVALYILGVPSIKEFTFPLIAGIFFGAFSSVFIATPLWAIWSSKKKLSEIK
jgi:preprotein translocase subunit SecF